MTPVQVTDSAAVIVLWWIGVVLALLVVVPAALLLLQRTLRAALHIRRFSAEALSAAAGVLENVRAVEALEVTVENAGPLVETGGRLHRKVTTLADTLSERGGG